MDEYVPPRYTTSCGIAANKGSRHHQTLPASDWSMTRNGVESLDF